MSGFDGGYELRDRVPHHLKIITVLERHSKLKTGNHRLAFAVIAQAIGDLNSFVLSVEPKKKLKKAAMQRRTHYSSTAARSALEFIESGCEPYASGLGLEPEFLLGVINTRPRGKTYGLLDAARNKLANPLAYWS